MKAKRPLGHLKIKVKAEGQKAETLLKKLGGHPRGLPSSERSG